MTKLPKLVPPTHDMMCLACGWHRCDGEHRCTKRRQAKWQVVVKMLKELFK